MPCFSRVPVHTFDRQPVRKVPLLWFLVVVARGSDGIGAVHVRPHSVVPALHVRALIRVASEEIALGLDKVGGQASATVRVEVSKAPAHGRGSDPGVDGGDEHAAPAVVARHKFGGEFGVHQEGGQVSIAIVRLLDAVKEACTDDATTFPDACHLSEVQVPALLYRLGTDEVHALCVRANLGRIQCGAHVVHQLGLVCRRHSHHLGVGRAESSGGVHSLGGDALVLETRQEACIQTRGHSGNCHRQFGRLLHRPLARALHARLVQDLVDQESLPGLLVVLLG
mmetsp:Transcript_11811/g.28673  ORF Transcript_11811/g.28673 Transcript_11811/m.28673 type:complete len:282 (-) Transcript_11811:1057-1902(-)